MDKERIKKLVGKILKAKKIMEEVDAEISTCDRIRCWQIYAKEDFEKVCEVLGLEYEAHSSNGNVHAKTYYNGFEICCVF